MLSDHRLSGAPLSTLAITGPTTWAGNIVLSGTATALLTQPAITGAITLTGRATVLIDAGIIGGEGVNCFGSASVEMYATTQYRELFRNFRSRLVYSAEIAVWATSDRDAA